MTQRATDDKSKGNGKGIFNTVRGGVFVLALATTLAVFGLGFAGHAEARVPDFDPRLDSLAATCGALQDQADALRAEYKGLGDTNPTSPRMGEILDQLRTIWISWDGVCSGTFGGIGFALPAPQVGGQATVGGTASEPPSGVRSPIGHKAGGVNTLGVSH